MARGNTTTSTAAGNGSGRFTHCTSSPSTGRTWTTSTASSRTSSAPGTKATCDATATFSSNTSSKRSRRSRPSISERRLAVVTPVITGGESILRRRGNFLQRGRPAVRRSTRAPCRRRGLRLGRLANPGPEAAANGRTQLGLPALWGQERGRARRLLVVRCRNRSLCLLPGPRFGFGDVAVPPMPRMEQHIPPLVLVVREHAGQTAEARRVILEDPAVQAAINLCDDSRDVGRPVRGEERNQIGDLLRRAHATHRDLLQYGRLYVLDSTALLLRPRAVQLNRPVCRDPPRSDTVHANPVFCDLPRERLQSADDPEAEGVREDEIVDRLAHGHREDRDHGSAAALPHRGQAGADEPDGALERQLPAFRPLVVGQGLEAAGRWTAGVRHEDVHATERTDGTVDESLHAVSTRDVCGNGDDLRVCLLAHRLRGVLERTGAPASDRGGNFHLPHCGGSSGGAFGDGPRRSRAGSGHDRWCLAERDPCWIALVPLRTRDGL